MMMENEITISTSVGKVNLLHFPPSKSINQKILCIHGYCCDARIFRYIGAKMSKHGYDVYAIDLFGHGKSDGPRGDPDFEETIKSINEIIDKICSSQSRVFLLGHSLGCTYVLWYIHTYRKNVDGIILMSPYLKIKGIKSSGGEAVPGFLRFLKLLLLRIVIPKHRVSAAKVVQNSILSTCETQQIMKDPQINYYYSYRYIIDVIGLKNSNPRKFANIDIPVLILHGKNDKNVFPEVSEGFFNMLESTKEKAIHMFDCDHWFYHSIFYNQQDMRYKEHERLHVVDTIIEWLEKNLIDKV